MDRRVVLIVDDDFDVRENVKMVLENEGYGTLEARNGVHALRLLQSLSKDTLPGLIVLDLMMDEMNGKEFLDVIKNNHQDDGWADIPILLVSAASSSILNDVSPLLFKMRKPVDLDTLLGLVDRLCRSNISQGGR